MYPILFAPLQGYTEDAYRRAHHNICGGVAAYFSPFVRLEHGELRSKELRDLKPDHNQGIPLIPQVIARDGQEMEVLVERVAAMGYREIDLNMGCPFPLQTRHGRGAGLLQHPDQVSEILSVMQRHPDLAFSVKMRLGMEQTDEWRQVMPILNEMPLQRLTVHPRVATQQYKGTVHRDAFDQLLAATHHPVVYNGDILSLADIRQLQADYGDRLSGVMIGRGLLAQPWLAREWAENTELPADTHRDMLRQLHSRLLAHYERVIPGEQQRMEKLRTMWTYMEQTLGRKQWKRVMKAGNMRRYLEAVDEALRGVG